MNIYKILGIGVKCREKLGGIHSNTCILATEGPKKPKLRSNDCYCNVL